MNKKYVILLVIGAAIAFPFIQSKNTEEVKINAISYAPVKELVNTKLGSVQLKVIKTFNWKLNAKVWDFTVTDPTASKVSIFALSNPARIVVDFTTKYPSAADVIHVGSIGLSQVRSGRHPNKTRLVFDLPGNEEPEFYSKVVGTTATIVIMK